MKNSLTALPVLVCVLAFSACKREESAEETRRDVAVANAEASADVAEAARDAAERAADAAENLSQAAEDGAEKITEASAEANEETAAARYVLAVAKAEAELKVAKEVCDGRPADVREACKLEAESAFEAEKTRALAERDAVKEEAAAKPQ
jgi:hypothetical protein